MRRCLSIFRLFSWESLWDNFCLLFWDFLVKHLLKKWSKSWCICRFLCVWWFSTHRGAECHLVSGDAEHPTLSAQAWLCRIAAVSVEQGLGVMCWAREGGGCLESELLLFPVYLCSITHEHQKVFSFSLCQLSASESSQSFFHLTQILFGPRWVSSGEKEVLPSENLRDVLVFLIYKACFQISQLE